MNQNTSFRAELRITGASKARYEQLLGETAKLKRQESVSVTRTLEHSQKSLTRSQARATQAILLQANAVSGAVGPAPSSG
jgi:hypothetical protein